MVNFALPGERSSVNISGRRPELNMIHLPETVAFVLTLDGRHEGCARISYTKCTSRIMICSGIMSANRLTFDVLCGWTITDSSILELCH